MASVARVHPLTLLLERQSGVITRRQIAQCGRSPRVPRSRLESGRWQLIHPGVYLTYSGPITWSSRAWAAVLACGRGAALSHRSAGYLGGLVASQPRQLDVTIPHDRQVRPLAGVRLHRTRRRLAPTGDPPRLGRAVTAIDLADAATNEDDVIGFLCAAARRGVPTSRLRQEVAGRARLRHRGLLHELVAEVAAGSESPLEHRFHRDVVRAHDLPASARQVWAEIRGLRLRADAVFGEYATRAELDGALAHPGGTTDADVWRDNEVRVDRSHVTLRYRWSHLAVRPCDCTVQLVGALRSGGWQGTARRCGPLCPVPNSR